MVKSLPKSSVEDDVPSPTGNRCPQMEWYPRGGSPSLRIRGGGDGGSCGTGKRRGRDCESQSVSF